jgi:NADPH2:quinone reductase
MTCTMRAYVTGEATPLTLTDRPLPALGREEVLVRTRAAALNNSDLTPSGDDHIAGFEFAGDVIEVGADAPAQLRGARVMGIAAGALAEVVVAHHRHVVAVPAALSYDEASTLPTALATEHGALTLGSVGPATSVLITAATSGIGIIGVQIAKFLGAATVVATTRSPHKRRLLEQAGADAVVITSADEDLVAGTRRVTGGNGARVVLDHVGGDRQADAVEAACDGGDVISVGRLGGARGSLDLFTLARRHVSAALGLLRADSARGPRRPVRQSGHRGPPSRRRGADPRSHRPRIRLPRRPHGTRAAGVGRSRREGRTPVGLSRRNQATAPLALPLPGERDALAAEGTSQRKRTQAALVV